MPGSLDPHMMAEAVTRTEHPTHDRNEPPRSWGTTLLLGLAIVVLALVLAAVWMWTAGEDTRLADTSWRLAGVYEGSDADLLGPQLDPDAYAVTLEFDGSEFRGDGPVNIFSGTYATSGEDLSLFSMVRTERGGPPEAMAAEERYAMLLSATNRFSMGATTLTLLDERGRQLLRYERVE